MNRHLQKSAAAWRHLITGVCLGLLGLATSSANAQTVSNVRATVAGDGAGAVITYDLQSAPGETAIVSLYYSLDGGGNYLAVGDPLSGDIGAGITGGTAKTIHWPRMGVSLHAFHGSQVKFRVAALPAATQYKVQFDTEMSSATEGQGTAVIHLSAREPYFGNIRYQIGAMTNVTTGTVGSDITPLSGEVQMVAGNATITVNINDDFVIEQPKALTLDLVYDDSLGYDIGPTFRHMLVLHDNDGYWNGVMMGEKASDAEQSFRMAIMQNGAAFQGKLISANTTSSLSTFPIGEWPLDITMNGNEFTARTQSAGLPVPATSIFPETAALKRHVTFTADTATTGIYKENVIIAGRFEDTLVGTGPAAYLGSDTAGGFALIKEQQAFVPPNPPILPLSNFTQTAGLKASHAEGVLNLSKGTKQ